MAKGLTVWLYGQPVAMVEEERRRLRLTYTSEALSRYALGTPLLSLSLPLRPERHTEGVVRPFLDGLLPEGAVPPHRRPGLQPAGQRHVRPDPCHWSGLCRGIGDPAG